MYCSEGSGKWGVDDSVGTAAELKEKRLELRRRLVQFSVLASMDLRRELKSDKVSMDVDADGEAAGVPATLIHSIESALKRIGRARPF